MYTYIYIYIYIYTHIYTHRELRKMRGWTISDVKKIKNLIKTFRSGIFFRGLSYYFQITDEGL